MTIRLPEILLIESIIFAALWILNDYVALILSITIPSIILAVWLISLVSEKIEKSNVPDYFFRWLFYSIFPPIIIGIVYTFFIDGQFTWMNQF